MVNSPIKAEDLATEFSVVRNEFESGENSPERVLSQRMTAVAYEWHNYGKSTIGNRSDIERVPVDNLRAFYKKFYQPDNAMLVVAGKFDEKKALEYIKKYFGASAQARPQAAGDLHRRAAAGRRASRSPCAGWATSGWSACSITSRPPRTPSSRRCEILGEILDAEPSGRLYKALVETKKATSVSVDARPRATIPGSIEIIAEVNTKDPAVLEKVRDAMLAVLEEVARSGVTQEEVDRARQKILKNRELAAADPNRIAIELSRVGCARRLAALLPQPRPDRAGHACAGQGGRRQVFDHQQPHRRLLRPDRQARADPGPAGARHRQAGRGLHRPPAQGAASEASDVAPLAIEARVQRPEPIAGVKLAFLPKKTRGESVQLRLTLHYGNAENLKGLSRGRRLPARADDPRHEVPDPPADPGCARQELRPARHRHGQANGHAMGGGPSVGSITFTVETKRANLPAVLEILRQILREPTLPASEFEVMKNERDRRRRAGPFRPHAPRASTTSSACSPTTPATTSATCRPSTSSSSDSSK